MDIAMYGGFTVIWWATSATVLLPLIIAMKFNKLFRDRWFSYMYTKVTPNEHKLLPLRKKIFELLSEHLIGRDITKPLKILEIGVGSGSNLQFYPVNSHLTTLDMNANFDSYLKQNQKKYSNIFYERSVISAAENMKDIEDCCMDVVVSTYVLCSVTNMKEVLKEIKRVLKPGGKFLFLEHVSFPKSDVGFILQKFASPLWTIYYNGCSLLRNIEEVVGNSGFSDFVCEKVYPKPVMLFIRPQIYGLATK